MQLQWAATRHLAATGSRALQAALERSAVANSCFTCPQSACTDASTSLPRNCRPHMKPVSCCFPTNGANSIWSKQPPGSSLHSARTFDTAHGKRHLLHLLLRARLLLLLLPLPPALLLQSALLLAAGSTAAGSLLPLLLVLPPAAGASFERFPLAWEALQAFLCASHASVWHACDHESSAWCERVNCCMIEHLKQVQSAPCQANQTAVALPTGPQLCGLIR